MLLPEKFCVDRGAHQFLLRSPRTTVDDIRYNQWTVQLYRTDDERDEWTSTCVQVDVVTMAYLNWWWILRDHPDPIVDGVPDDLTVVIDYDPNLNGLTTTTFMFPDSTTTRAPVDLTTQAGYCDKLHWRAWSYSNCDTGRCTSPV